MTKSQKLILRTFIIYTITIVLFTLFLKAASGHRFYFSLSEKLGYLTILLSIVLVSLQVLFSKKAWSKAMKYVTILSLLGTFVVASLVIKDTITIDYESFIVALIFYLTDLLFLVFTAMAIYVVFKRK